MQDDFTYFRHGLFAFITTIVPDKLTVVSEQTSVPHDRAEHQMTNVLILCLYHCDNPCSGTGVGIMVGVRISVGVGVRISVRISFGGWR